MSRGTNGSAARRVLVALACIAVLGTSAGADPDVARLLMKHGREALEKGNLDDAITRLEKARAEEPALVEATFWIAAVLEKRAETPRAIDEYRAFLTALAARPVASWSKDEAGLQKRALARLDALDPAGREVERAQAAFAAQIVAYAKSKLDKAPAAAERALRLLLATRPGHPEATTLLARVSGPPAASSGSIFEPFGDEWDLVKSHGLGKNNGWTYDDRNHLITIDIGKGSVVWSPGSYESGPRYAYEMEVMFDGAVTPGSAHLVGLAFGRRGEEGFALMTLADRAVLERFEGSKHGELVSAEIPAWEIGGRRKIAVVAEGKTMKAYVDGKPVLEHALETRDFGGDLGVIHENCRVRVRSLRFGRPAQGKGK